MRQTALDRDGHLAIVDGRRVRFHQNEQHVLPVDPYAAVYAGAGIVGAGVLLYRQTDPRDNEVNTVWYATSRGKHGMLAEQCEGKWPLAICALDEQRFLCAWIKRDSNVSRVGLAIVGLDPHRVEFLDDGVIPPSMMLLEVKPDLSFIVDDTGPEAGGRRFVEVTAGGVRWTLLHEQEVNGRHVGVDGVKGAPNRVLLADRDGWYLVAQNDKAHLMPPRLDKFGNVATFGGNYFPNAEIRTRPITLAIDLPEPKPTDPHATCRADISDLRVQVDLLERERADQQRTNLNLVLELDRLRGLVPMGRVWTDAELRTLVNDVTGRLGGIHRYIGTQGTVDKAINERLQR
jgi:hypothetical protein